MRKVYALIDYCNYKIFLIKYFFVNIIKVCMFFLNLWEYLFRKPQLKYGAANMERS